jgi:hypothetical protein
LVTIVIFRSADLPIKNAIMPKSQLVADGVGLSVLAAEAIVGLGVISYWTPNPGADRLWYALPLEFLISYSILCLSAIYLWRNHGAIRTPAHWLAFMALSSVLLLVGTGYIRLSGGAGIIVGIASTARSLVLKKQTS